VIQTSRDSLREIINDFQDAAAHHSPEHRVFFLGCAEIFLIYVEKIINDFQDAAAHHSPEHRVFRAEISC